MASRIRALVFTLLIYLAFFCSGAACLVAEVSWNRMLIVVVGNSLSATAFIIAVFMGGLGLGSFLGGRFLARRTVDLKPYLVLEVLIGIYVALSPWVMNGLSSFFSSVSGGGIDPALLSITRILVTLLALAIPAILMGATFPAIIAGTAQATAQGRTARTGYLYSINTLGAAIGCFAAGFHLLLEFGVQVTLNVALGLYLVASISALIANYLKDGGKAGSKAAEEKEEVAPPAPSLRRYLYVATFVVGFVSLGYEVLLTRVSILFLGNSVSVFSQVLTAFLLGTGFSAIFGTWFYGWLKRRNANADLLFPLSLVIAGAFIVLTPYLLLSEKILGIERYARMADAGPMNPLPILGLMILPTIFIGALLPLAIRMMNPARSGDNTREAAFLYTVNTVGGVLGAAMANHYLVPIIGVQGVIGVLAAALVFIALGKGLFSKGVGGLPVPLAGAVGLVVVLGLFLPDMMNMYAQKVSRGTLAHAAEVKLVHEGKACTVTVVDQFDPRLGSYRDMYLNGVEEASTRYWHVQLFKLLGILPPVLHESEEELDAMVIAFGAGITAGSVLASDQVRSLDVADLNPDIEGINDLFTEVNGDVFHGDRFHFRNEDGRNFLLTAGKQYDLIIGDSTHPRAYDSWILYTEEFYELAKSRLKPGGIFAQWVPVLRSMQGELMHIHINTFRKVFPNTTFWYVYGSDQAFLLATPEPFELDVARTQARLDRLPQWFRAEEYQIDTVGNIAGFYWMDGAAMDLMLAGEQRVNRDGAHYIGKQSAAWTLPPMRQLPFFQASITPHLQGADRALLEEVQLEQGTAGHLGKYAFFRASHPAQAKSDLEAAFCMHPGNGNARYFMELESGGELPDTRDFCLEREINSYAMMLKSQPSNAGLLNALASSLTQAGRLDEALLYARKAVALQPDNGMMLDTLGWAQFQQGDLEAAAATLADADRNLPDHPIVLYHRGLVAQGLGRAEEARKFLSRALEVDTRGTLAADDRQKIEFVLQGG
jgi:spermidine synthase